MNTIEQWSGRSLFLMRRWGILVWTVALVMTMTGVTDVHAQTDWDVRVGHHVGTISKQRPVFGFRYSMAGPNWTQAWINRNGQTYWIPWIEHNATTGELRWTPSQNLPPGHYEFWMRGWSSSGGYTSWSDRGTFTIASAAPAAPVLTQPTGNITDARPQFRWNQAARAEYYRLYVTRGGTVVIDQWVQSTSATPTSNLPAGSYTWWVGSWNSATRQTVWSSSKTFSIASAAPAAPVLTQPTGNITDARPQFRWNQAARAEYYRLYVTRGGTVVIDQWVQSTSVTPTSNLPAGSYTWWVGAWNQASGQTVWSSGATFTLGDDDDTSQVGQYEARAHQLVNNHRAANGRAALTYNSSIAAIARQHSQAAADGTITRAQFGAHHNASSRYDQVRATVLSWSMAAENVAWMSSGFADPPLTAFQGWRDSSGHNANMLNGQFTHTGIGAARAPDGTWYFTQLFFKSP